jgi:hypothetical protein
LFVSKNACYANQKIIPNLEDIQAAKECILRHDFMRDMEFYLSPTRLCPKSLNSPTVEWKQKEYTENVKGDEVHGILLETLSENSCGCFFVTKSYAKLFHHTISLLYVYNQQCYPPMKCIMARLNEKLVVELNNYGFGNLAGFQAVLDSFSSLEWTPESCYEICLFYIKYVHDTPFIKVLSSVDDLIPNERDFSGVLFGKELNTTYTPEFRRKTNLFRNKRYFPPPQIKDLGGQVFFVSFYCFNYVSGNVEYWNFYVGKSRCFVADHSIEEKVLKGMFF